MAEPDFSGGEIEVVVDDNDVGGGYIVEFPQGGDGFARVIHEGHGLHEVHGAVLDRAAHDLGVLFERAGEGEVVLACDGVEDVETDIVFGIRVLGAGVTQAHNHPGSIHIIVCLIFHLFHLLGLLFPTILLGLAAPETSSRVNDGA